ncbi:hypothetical protein P152DRAFT_458420 [Eremomyces bilateralis CBS 781.70]|uniref:Nicotinamide N-methyltransferase n=1 Tax=Eremomyces bilateralis CBS 781.70 TaxID=1392243 RepID=A0A6G1G3G0_9PEZI|nr:uncharacterized protein P152DRAFT_458420 [Eremomyces bilateralis CBS 781.70]KAF1812594.1 hypothetical protein P152DRAFT_458420 [Eremomyces bilateralis CBS 781.70]
MSSLVSLVSSPPPLESTAAQQPSYVTYHFPVPCSSGSAAKTSMSPSWGAVTTLESRHILSSSGTTGLRTWEAALHLGAYLSSNGQESGKLWVRGKHVLELGAGTGLLSILCAKHLATRTVTATDGDERVLETLENNAFLNMPESDTIKSFPFRWGRSLVGTLLEKRIMADDPVDLVIGADIVGFRTICFG